MRDRESLRSTECSKDTKKFRYCEQTIFALTLLILINVYFLYSSLLERKGWANIAIFLHRLGEI